jgi:hypothetical protein
MSTTPERVPMAGAAAWSAVMDRAGWRCQCTRCPKHRRDPEGRCQSEMTNPRSPFAGIGENGGAGIGGAPRLSAGPASPSPDPARDMATDTADLVAWCGPCWDRAVTAARTFARTGALELGAPTTEPLF